MSKKKNRHGARTKQKTAARKRKLQAQRIYSGRIVPESETVRPDISELLRKNKKLIIALSAALGAILLVAAVCIAAVCIITSRVTVEVGDVPDFTKLDTGLGSVICTEHGSAESVDTSDVGEQRVECIFFGFVRKNMTVRVCDTVAPIIETVGVTARVGEKVMPDDFILVCDDLTETSVEFTETPTTDAAGEYRVKLTAVDKGGNRTDAEARMTVADDGTEAVIEYGTDAAEAAKICADATGAEITEDMLDVSACGDCRILAPYNGGRKIINVSVKDTTAPTANAMSFDIVLGERLSIEEILTDVHDESEVAVKIGGESDYTEVGNYTADIEVTDIWGNTADFKSAVRVHDIRKELTVEAGTPTDEIIKLILGDDDSLEIKLTDGIQKKLGEHEVEAVGKHSTIRVMLMVEDTTAPVLTVRDTVAFVGQEVKPESFVVSCKDATDVSFSLKEEVRTEKPNETTVAVIAEDAAGNTAEKQARLLVTIDEQPPVIYGVSTVYVNLGESVSYLSGVYAVDNADGVTEVTVDDSNVNTSAAGTYYVTYRSVDKAGNEGTLRGSVVVNSISQETVDRLADGILSAITTGSMTAREKAWAIYNWCRNNIKYSTRTSYLMGKFIDGAYSGFKTRMGNCYIYYAVSSAMLTRAGIENIEIRRNSTTNPHYWNLVKIDGNWYHFDTCPHYAEYPITSFLLTDAEVRDYSENQAIGYYDFDSSLYPATP